MTSGPWGSVSLIDQPILISVIHYESHTNREILSRIETLQQSYRSFESWKDGV